LAKLELNITYKGYGLFRLFLCSLLQYMEDLSDRELEKMIRENNCAKWFCEFDILDVTPDHTVFCRFRKSLGTSRLGKIFSNLRDQLKSQGYMNEVFSFVDASHLISKSALWEERDKAIKDKHDKLNNDLLPKYARDKQAKVGSKGKNKFWYGFKKHVSVDMQSGMINKVAVTPANLIDSKGLDNVCPDGGAIYADKGYCDKNAKRAARNHNCHLAAIKKNNMKQKNRDLDRWISGIRSPYERVFSKTNHRVRYLGVAKNQFTEFMTAIAFNLKRLVVLSEDAPPNLATS
jgi:IS5 family transposase